MNIIRTLKECIDVLPTVLTDGQEHFAFIIHQNTEVGYGFDNDVNLEYCEKNNIPCYDQKRNGGTIVCSAGNIGIAFIYNNRIRGGFVLDRMLPDLSRYLSRKGLHTKIDSNDLLIDGYKVASASGYNFGEKYHYTYEAVQISINQDIEAIKNICKKPMVKIPKGLSEYGITTKEIADWCSKWLSEHLGIKM